MQSTIAERKRDKMDMESLLREAVDRHASDLHVTVGVPPILRINGVLTKLDLPILSVADTLQLFEEIVADDRRTQFNQNGEVDFSHTIFGLSRFRVNAFRQRGSIAIAIRIIPERVPKLATFTISGTCHLSTENQEQIA